MFHFHFHFTQFSTRRHFSYIFDSKKMEEKAAFHTPLFQRFSRRHFSYIFGVNKKQKTKNRKQKNKKNVCSKVVGRSVGRSVRPPLKEGRCTTSLYLVKICFRTTTSYIASTTFLSVIGCFRGFERDQAVGDYFCGHDK